MSRIKGKNTKPEILVRSFLHRNGLRFRLHHKDLPGKPDIVLKKHKTAIFVHGCFWHRHKNCKYASVPKTRTDWWLDKLNSNVERDEGNYAVLKEMDWKVVVIWECDLKPKNCDETLNMLLSELMGSSECL